jgi:hypothetical protein
LSTHFGLRFLAFAHLARAAFFAASDRSFAVIFAALACPPFAPASRVPIAPETARISHVPLCEPPRMRRLTRLCFEAAGANREKILPTRGDETEAGASVGRSLS